MSHSESHYPQMEETCNSGKPSQEWLAEQNYSMSAVKIHPGCEKGIWQKEQQASLASVKITLHASTIRMA